MSYIFKVYHASAVGCPANLVGELESPSMASGWRAAMRIVRKFSDSRGDGLRIEMVRIAEKARSAESV